MISISCDHPDIEDFITIKSDLNKITKANLSIRVTNEFMQAVKDDATYTLSFTREETGEKIKKTIKAKELFDKFCYMNWDYGEPAFLFWDRVKSYNLLSEDDAFEYAGVNPCLSGSTLIQTTEGNVPIKDLVGKTPDVYCMNDNGELAISKATKVWCTRKDAQTVTVHTGKGDITCTPDHLIFTTNRGWVEAKSLKRGDKIKGLNRQMKGETHVSVGLNWYVKDVSWNTKTEDVYDITVPEFHNFIANDMVVHNCAEEPLPSGGSCLLGSLNLSAFVETINGQPQFNMDEFRKAVVIAVYGLNDVLDEGLLLHPLEVQRDSVRDWRQIGLGIMGLADMLIKLGVTYGSEESLVICDDIGWNLANEALQTSMTIAKNKGEYPMFSDKVWDSDFYKNHIGISAPLRNSQLLTIAPTGTLSTMLGISGGVEPIFANYYTRRTESLHGEEKEYKIFTPIAWEYLQEHGYGEDETKLPSYFITSAEIPYRNRIDMQATWQRHIDASISSTVNLPNSATIDDVKDLYMYAWEQGLKGITVFRDGCKRLGILTTDNTSNEVDDDEPSITSLPRGVIEEVSDDLISAKRTIVNGCGRMYLHLDFDENTGQPLETFLECGSGGGCERNLTFISRLMSLALRGGVPIESIIDQAFSVKPCKAYCDRRKKFNDTSKGNSCPQAIGHALVELNKKIQDRCFADDDGYEYDELTVDVPHALSNLTPKEIRSETKEGNDDIIYNDDAFCPECGAKLQHQGGCVICVGDATHAGCGWSKCG